MVVSPNGIRFLQEEVNYLGEFTRHEQGVNQSQTIRPNGWDENFYMTYAPAKYNKIENAYEEFPRFLK